MIKDTAIEIRELTAIGHIELYVHINILNESFDSIKNEGIKIINPIEGLKLLDNLIDKYHWVDSKNILIQWENKDGERSTTFSDVGLLDDNTGEYDAWFVAEVILNRISNITNSKIGSTKWFKTIVGNHLRIGELLKENSNKVITGLFLNDWGEKIYDSSKELLEWQEKNKSLTND